MDKSSALVADRYRLGRVIGMGGMGVVYEAEQLPLRRTVALKMLTRERVGSEDAVERLIEEARALSRIEHPGVVRVIDAGRDTGGQAFLAMEYLEGQTLKQLLAEHGPLPWRWVVAVIGQCLEALEVVHGAGFIHRDIKPSNCFCCAPSPPEGVPVGPEIPVIKLIDFGVARAERSQRRADRAAGWAGEACADGPLLGTPAYWAPEQAESGQATRRSDIYSVGVSLCELLTGELPTRASDGSVEPPSAINPAVGIPPGLDAVVLRALSADSAQRFESAAALLAALREIDGDSERGTTTWPGTERPAIGRTLSVHGPSTSGTRSGEGIQLQRLRSKVREFWIEGLKFGCVLALFTTAVVGGVHGISAAMGLLSHSGKPVGGRQHWARVVLLGLVSGGINALAVGIWAGHPMAAVLAGEVAVLAAPLVCPHREIGFSRGDIRLIDRLRFSFRKALRAAAFGCAAGVIAALGVADDATAMMVVILYLTSLWFLFGGLRGRQVSTRARTYVGVTHSLSWSVALGLLAIPLTALPTAMTYGVLYGLCAGLTTGAVLWLWYGGMALVQYAVLRSMLSLQGARFFRSRYLEAAADRALLHRLGSGYLFVHPMLRQSFARRWEARSSLPRCSAAHAKS